MELLARRVAGEAKPPYEIKERTFEFGVMVVRFVNRLPNSLAGRELGRQLIRAGTSVGANVEEADAAESDRDFVHKMSIARKEARESRYWLKLLKESGVFQAEGMDYLVQEATELIKILSTIIKNKLETKPQ
jgi:four helix bundle protein